MKLLNKASVFFFLFLLSFCVLVLPSFTFGLTELFNEKRIAEGAVLICAAALFFILYSNKSLNIEPREAYLISILLTLLLISVFFSAYPGRAFLEIGWFIALIQLALVLGVLYKDYPQMFEKILLVGIIMMAGIYSVRVYGEILTYFLRDNYPMWPNHRISTIIINGENIAENGFLGFLNFRFFNHLQTWSMPVLLYSYFHFQNRIEPGFKYLLGFLISTWWMLVFASGARGTLIALTIGLITVAIFFRKHIIQFLKLYGITFTAGLVMYALIFLVFTEGSGKEVIRSDSSGRLELWVTTLKSIMVHPIFGVGPMHLADVGEQVKITSPHNIYLMWAAEWGLPAFFLFLYLVTKSFYNWIKKVSRNPSLKEIVITFTFIAGAAHSCVSGLLISPLSQLLFAVILGWALGLYYSENGWSLFKKERGGLGVRYVLLAVLLLVNIITFHIFLADIPNLEQNREKFQSLHRENKIEMNQKTNPTIFPRFWDQGFIGLEQLEEKE